VLALQASVFYPKDADALPKPGDETFPVIAFGHGWGVDGPYVGPSYSKLLTTIASFGFIIIAPESCSENIYCTTFDQDLYRALDFAKNASTPGSINGTVPRTPWRHADVSRLGIAGHSMGGDAAAISAGMSVDRKRHNISAVVALNPGCMFDGIPVGADVDTPIMYTTGAEDTVVLPAVVWTTFLSTHYKPRVFANTLHGSHFETVSAAAPFAPSFAGAPTTFDAAAQMNECEPLLGTKCHVIDPWAAFFLLCHINGDGGACELIYGRSKGSLCHGGGGPMFPGGCVTVK